MDEQRGSHTTAQTNQQQRNTNRRGTSHRSRTAFTPDQSERLEKGDHFSLSLSAQSHLCAVILRHIITSPPLISGHSEFICGLYPDLLTREKLSEETNLPQNTIKAIQT